MNPTLEPLEDRRLLSCCGGDLRPPAVDELRFFFQDRQAIGVDFDEQIEAATFTATDVTVRNLTTDAVLPAARFSVIEVTPSRAFDLVYDTANFGPLPDGNYEATVAAGAVTDTSGNASVGPAVLDFFVLAADANRDRTVNLADFGRLRAGFGEPGTFATGDFNYDGTVNLADFGILRGNFGQTLPPPSSSIFAAFAGKDRTQRSALV
jgi:hypothetical protein